MPSHKCPECKTKFSSSAANAKPRALQCGHSFCSQCLSGLKQTRKKKNKQKPKGKSNCLSFPARSRAGAAATPSRTFSCPTCKHESCYGSEDPGPCVNFALMNLEFKCGICFEPDVFNRLQTAFNGILCKSTHEIQRTSAFFSLLLRQGDD